MNVETHTLDEVFRLIARSAIGRDVLERFLPEYQRGEVLVQQLDELSPRLLQLKTEGMAGSPAGGFLYTSGKKEIFILNHPAVGVRAPLLLHEMVHATDSRYLASFGESTTLWCEFRSAAESAMRSSAVRLRMRDEEITGADLSRDDRLELIRLKRKAEAFDRVRLFRAERRAYTALYCWVKEICVRVPGYEGWLKGSEAAGFGFDREISDSEIIHGYGLRSVA